MSARHPRSMYKGGYTEHAINADHQIANDEAREAELREDGYVDGHEFFSQSPVEQEEAESESDTPSVAPTPKKRGRKAKAVAAEPTPDVID